MTSGLLFMYLVTVPLAAVYGVILFDLPLRRSLLLAPIWPVRLVPFLIRSVIDIEQSRRSIVDDAARVPSDRRSCELGDDR